MPFVSQTSRPFTQVNVQALTAGQRGVYGLFREGLWVYIGKSEDIRRRLLEHLGGDNPCITLNRPTLWVSEITSNDANREKELIREFNPVCNRQVG